MSALRLNFRQTAAAAGLACSTLLIGGCHYNSASNNSDTGGRASLGVIRNATVNFYQNDGTTLIASGETGSSGEVFTPRTAYTGPIVIEVLGDDIDAVYFDEAAGADRNFTAGNSLFGLASAPGQFVAITPLTHLAYRGAVDQGIFPLSATEVNAVNEAVRLALAPELTNILTPATVFDANTSTNSLDDSQADRYALRLAALAMLASSSGAPAVDMLNAMAADIADGVLDNVPASGLYTNFANEIASALSSAVNTYGTTALQTAVQNYPATVNSVDFSAAGDDSGNTGGADDLTTPATVSATLSASYDLVYNQHTAGGPFTDDQAVAVVVDNNTLEINGKTLTNPFHRSYDNGSSYNMAEVFWVDADENIEYALTDNTSGNFNEINVGDVATGGAGFLGQLKLPEENDGGPTDDFLALAGNYSGGVVSTSSGFNPTYSAKQDINVSIASDGTVTVDASGGNYVFDPSDASYEFTDLTSNEKEPSYRVSFIDDDVTYRFDVGLGDGDTPVAYRLRQSTATGPGSSTVATVEFEDGLRTDAINGLFTNLNAATPATLTVVEQSNGFTNGLMVCDTFQLDSKNSGLEENIRNTAAFSYTATLPGASFFFGGENYRRFSTRFINSNGGDTRSLRFGMRTLSFTTGGIVELKADTQTNATDRATNDPAEISAAGCGGISDPEEGNTGKAQCDGNCVTAVVADTTYIYTETMSVIGDSNTDGGFAIIEARNGASTPSLFRVGFGSSPGTYSCDSNGDDYLLSHVHNGGFGPDGGNGTGDGSCVIKVLQAGPIYEGYFIGDLDRSAQGPNRPVTNGYFYFDPTPPGSGGSGLPAGTNASTVNIVEAGSSFAVGDSFLVPQSGSGNTRPGQVFANFVGDGIDFFQLIGLDQTVTGTYPCNQGPNGQFQTIGMSLDFSYSASNSGGSCSVTVSSIDNGVYEGSYTGTLTNDDGTDDIGVDGDFRFALPD